MVAGGGQHRRALWQRHCMAFCRLQCAAAAGCGSRLWSAPQPQQAATWHCTAHFSQPLPHRQTCLILRLCSAPGHQRAGQAPGQGTGCPAAAAMPRRRPPAPGPSAAARHQRRWWKAALAAAQPVAAVAAWRAPLPRLAEADGTAQRPALCVVPACRKERKARRPVGTRGRLSKRFRQSGVWRSNLWWIQTMAVHGIQPASRPPCGRPAAAGGPAGLFNLGPRWTSVVAW